MCGKFYVDNDKARLFCVNDACQRRHVWCKCWKNGILFCPVEKKKKLNKYYKKTVLSLIEVICIDLCKKYCTGCFFGSPSSTHSCLLHRDDKIKKYARVAIQIINKSGIVCFNLRKILEEKKKIVFF